jgi:hypothetical protein
MTVEAFQSIKKVLKPGGALVINMFGEVEPGQDFFTASLNKTLRAVFKGVRMHGTGEGAVFFTAIDVDEPRIMNPPEPEFAHPIIREDYRETMASTVSTDPASGIVLTDDYNPIEYYDAHNREDTRKKLAMAFKDL